MSKPTGRLSIRTIAMPADANPIGTIFGGWVLAQMDLAGGNHAFLRAQGPVTTVAVEGMEFHLPIMVGDEVSCYTEIVRIGTTSLSIRVQTWVRRGCIEPTPTLVTRAVSLLSRLPRTKPNARSPPKFPPKIKTPYLSHWHYTAHGLHWVREPTSEGVPNARQDRPRSSYRRRPHRAECPFSVFALPL